MQDKFVAINWIVGAVLVLVFSAIMMIGSISHSKTNQQEKSVRFEMCMKIPDTMDLLKIKCIEKA